MNSQPQSQQAETRPLSLVETAKAGGALGFVLIGLGGLIASGSYLQNFLPLGEPGERPALNGRPWTTPRWPPSAAPSAAHRGASSR